MAGEVMARNFGVPRNVMLEAARGTRAGVLEGMARLPGVRLPVRERADLARRAFALAEKSVDSFRIARELGVSEPTARNLVAYGRRLAAGGEEKLEWR